MIFRKNICIPVIFCALVFISCKPKDTQIEAEVVEKKTAVLSYHALVNQDISNLYSIVDKFDMIFYEMPISVNKDDAASAKNSVLYVTPSPVELNASCKAWGRL